MNAREKFYGIMVMAGALLLAGCSQEDATTEVAALAPVAIAFDFSADSNTAGDSDTATDNTGDMAVMTRAGQTDFFSTTNDLLHRTGFGLFAGHLNEAKTAAASLDFMYNQEVRYTFLADDDNDKVDDPTHPYGNGYWSYYPLKYWPNNPDDINRLFFCAYAPYVETADGTTTGITAISANSVADPYIEYTWADKPEDTVDLLWGCWQATDDDDATTLLNLRLSPVKMKMRHALARIAVSVRVDNLPADTKVLLKSITLSGTMTLTARLRLNTTGETPRWDDQADTDERTITIGNDPDNTDSYGLLDNSVRYIEGLPYSWQPDGAQADPDAGDDDDGNGYTNALSYDGHQAYVYLIPQDNLSLQCKVAYNVMTPSTTTPGVKTTEDAVAIDGLSPLEGNKTYHLKLTLKL